MRRAYLWSLLAGIVVAAGVARASDREYAVGADVSFLRDAEQKGVKFRDGGVAKPGLDILHDHGYGWVRLRLFNSPQSLPNNLEYTIALARDAKQRGMKFLLDYHYSDDWADPGKQTKPAAWTNLTFAELEERMYEYNSNTIATFKAAGAMLLRHHVSVGGDPEIF